MKKIILILAIYVLVFPGFWAAYLPAQSNQQSLESIRAQILEELNLARTQPAKYAEFVQAYAEKIGADKIYREEGKIPVRLNEGKAATSIAIKFLQNQKPLPSLAMSLGMNKAAQLHADEQSKTGATGHIGVNKSTPGSRVNLFGAWGSTIAENIAYGQETARMIVLQLIIDDGVSDRGHRTNIFNPKITVVGIGNSTHPKFRTVTVMVYAGSYTDKL